MWGSLWGLVERWGVNLGFFWVGTQEKPKFSSFARSEKQMTCGRLLFAHSLAGKKYRFRPSTYIMVVTWLRRNPLTM